MVTFHSKRLASSARPTVTPEGGEAVSSPSSYKAVTKRSLNSMWVSRTFVTLFCAAMLEAALICGVAGIVRRGPKVGR